MRLAILLTATIKPSAVGGNFSSEVRAEMYISTLKFYANTIGRAYKFVFLENSDYDLSVLKKSIDNKLDIEWLQFSPSVHDDFDPKMGKGYNEYLMIKKAILHSQVLTESTHFLKLNGRYSLLNIKTILKEIQYRCNNSILFMSDIKDTRLWEILSINRTSHWGDSRFWVAQIAYYKQDMIECYQEMNDAQYGKWAEDYLLRFSRKYRKDQHYIWRFRHQVQFDGVGGTLTTSQLLVGQSGQNSLNNRIKNKLRHMLRLLFPNIWF
jgi:hypothetical protein